MATSQALDELLAADEPAREAVALVPENDEMVLDNGGNFDVAKTDLYRAEIGQAPVDSQSNREQQPADVLPEHGQHPDAVHRGQRPYQSGSRPIYALKPPNCSSNSAAKFLCWRMNLYT